MKRLHDAQLAGRWYERDPLRLEESLRSFLASEAGDGTPPPAALIVPHAAYVYSGRAAGAAYALTAGATYDRVVLLAPSHFEYFRGAALLDWEGFHTPLGEVRIDQATVARLADHSLCRIAERPFAQEHSLEIQLPFLQIIQPGVPVVPLLVGQLDEGDAGQLAEALKPLAQPRVLFVVSSDFTHYGRRFGYLPFPPANADEVRTALSLLDGGAIEAVCGGEAGAFRAYLRQTGATICGQLPIEVFLLMNAGRMRGELVSYYTSLDMTDDFEHSVSYASIRFPADG